MSLTPAILEGSEIWEIIGIALTQRNAPSTIFLKLRPQILRILEKIKIQWVYQTYLDSYPVRNCFYRKAHDGLLTVANSAGEAEGVFQSLHYTILYGDEIYIIKWTTLMIFRYALQQFTLLWEPRHFTFYWILLIIHWPTVKLLYMCLD